MWSWDELSRQREREHDTREQWKAVYGWKDSSAVGSHIRWGRRSGQGQAGNVFGILFEVWCYSQRQEDIQSFKGLWQGSGKYRIKFAFYLSCLFNFVFCFCFYIPNSFI